MIVVLPSISRASACVISVSVRAFGAVYRMLHCAEFE